MKTSLANGIKNGPFKANTPGYNPPTIPPATNDYKLTKAGVPVPLIQAANQATSGPATLAQFATRPALDVPIAVPDPASLSVSDRWVEETDAVVAALAIKSKSANKDFWPDAFDQIFG